MAYRRFEELVIALGVGAVSAALLLSVSGGLTAAEVMPELLLLGVLVGAVHWGRRGGFVAAALASLIDVAYSVPMLMGPAGTDWATVGLLVARLSAYGIIGILGGEICVRVRHAFIRLEHEGAFDEWSSLYNQRFFGKQLDVAVSRCERYNEPASVVLLTISASGQHRASRQHALVREISAELLDGVRNADVVARLDDGRFALLLPHTPKRSAETVASRVRTSVRLLVSVPDDALAAVVLGAPEDVPALKFLVKQCLREVDGQDASGAYSSAASSTRKPAEESTASAPAASTLKMSTAASPDGSTKA
jgi:diguanylate cyclase (GGDEF)-like protein